MTRCVAGHPAAPTRSTRTFNPGAAFDPEEFQFNPCSPRRAGWHIIANPAICQRATRVSAAVTPSAHPPTRPTLTRYGLVKFGAPDQRKPTRYPQHGSAEEALTLADLAISKHGGQGSRNAPHKPWVLAAGTAANPPRRGSINRRRADQRHHTSPPPRSAAAPARPTGTCCANHDQHQHQHHQHPTPAATIRGVLLSHLNP